MEQAVKIHTPLAEEICRSLNVGDPVLLSGAIYTGRDVAHRRLWQALLEGEELPVHIHGEVMFYAAPTPARPGQIIGSIGPTTSYRMDRYTPKLLEAGLMGMIGKGKRSAEVRDAMVKYHAVYFGAMGGLAALMADCIVKAEVVAYHDLGPEAIMRLEVRDMPLIVVNDAHGRDLFEEAVERYCLYS